MIDVLKSNRAKQFLDSRNLVLYAFALIILAVAWSGAKTMQNNYQLQKKISTINQQNEVLRLQNQNAALQNKYYQTDDYLDLAARQDLGLAAPGEKVLLVPKNVALKYVNSPGRPQPKQASADNRSKYIKNLEDWRDFLLGRKPTEG